MLRLLKEEETTTTAPRTQQARTASKQRVSQKAREIGQQAEGEVDAVNDGGSQTAREGADGAGQ